MQGKGGERSTSLAEQPPEERSSPYPARSLILPIEEVPYQFPFARRMVGKGLKYWCNTNNSY
uniref:Uncharacterized protein n=1 Tax=Triticum urartu TaxID=4572 RepID=A0A8R7V144_TRIUA